MKYRLIILAAAMAISVMFGAVRTTREALPSGGTEDMGAYYVAEGEPRTFQDPQTGKIEVISSAGNEYTASGNRLTVICKTEGRITYQIRGRKKSFRIMIGGNRSTGENRDRLAADDRITPKEFNLPSFRYKNRTYTNFADFVRKHTSGSSWVCMSTGKKAVKRASKYNRGITFHSDQREIQRKYPSWEDLGTYGADRCFYAARYYDKKSGFVLLKGFLVNEDFRVKKILYIGYNPRGRGVIVRLQKSIPNIS